MSVKTISVEQIASPILIQQTNENGEKTASISMRQMDDLMRGAGGGGEAPRLPKNKSYSFLMSKHLLMKKSSSSQLNTTDSFISHFSYSSNQSVAPTISDDPAAPSTSSLARSRKSFIKSRLNLKSQLNDGVKCLEQRLDTQIAILFELQDFFKKRAEVEMQYSRDLDKLVKQVYTRHKSERTKRENWPLHSAYKLWESLLNDTKQHSKYHQIASDVCSKYVADRFDDIVDDIKRMFTKCKAVAQSAHEEIFKVVGELNGAMKTYHEYQSESKQAEAKLRYVQSQKPKYEKQKSKKKLKQYEKQVEKRLQKYTETKVKAFKARNEYILSIDSANACINKFCSEDIGDIVDCMDYGFHASVAKCIYMYLSAQENIKRSRQQTVDNISRSIGDLDSNADKKSYLDFYSFIFAINRKFAFEPHKGDEVSQVNAQSLIRYEMEKRFEQLDMRLKTLKTENDEIFKTIEATEHSLLNYFDVKNCDMTDLFRDLNIPVNGANTPAGAASKAKRIEIEDYYVEKVRQYSISSNLIARLEARHRMMQKALGGCVNSSELDKTSSFDKSSPTITSASMHSNLLNMGSSFGGVGSGGSGGSERKKKIGKSPLIGQPRLFGGKLVEYLAATKQDLPQIMTSCVKAINRLGLHNQGIFRIPGSQLEINQFKEAFEKGDDPLVTVNPREMNSVAGVLKLYLRELKEPLFPRDLYDQFIGALRVSLPAPPPPPQSASSDALLNGGGPANDLSSNSSTASPGENIEAAKIDSIRRTMALVPKPIYIVIRYLFAFLNHLSEYKDENMMDAYNIAICLAPTLIPVPEDKKDQVNHQTDTIELIKLIIQHNDEIFNIECDGPVYEKFDSEMDNDEENLDESEDDEEDESEKQYLRNISDDELYVAEAIALYDYKGRTDKELSFKKGTQLAIRGQLSTDWWQGSLIASNNGANTPLKVGYIPDKYIAFRSSSKKRHLNTSSSTAQTTVQSTTTSSPLQLLTNMSSSAAVINTTKSTPPANNMNQSLRSSHHHTIHHHPHHHPYPLPHHNHGSATRASLDILELSSVSHHPPPHQYRHQRGASTDPLLCSQPHVKESDILNDECDNTASNPSNSMNEIIAAAALAAAAAVDQTAANLNEELHLQRFQPNSSSMRSASVSLQHKASSNNYSAANRMHSQSIKKRNSSSPSSSNSISFDTHFVNSVNQVANNTSNNTNTLTQTRQYNSNNGNYLNMSSSTTGTLSNRGVASRSSYTKSSSSNNTAANRGVVTSPANRSGSGLDMELAYLLASTTSAAAAAVAAASQSINNNVPKQQMKVNHIEDALASVLDDMKKLDCSGNLNNEVVDDINRKGTVSHQPPPLFSTRSTSSSSSASNTPSATTPHQRTRESNANGSFTTTTPPPPPPVHSYSAFKFSSDSSSSSQDNPKYEEKPLSNDSKTSGPNSTESETKRPDLVIDLPIVMAANNTNSSSPSSSTSASSQTTSAATVLPIKKPPMVSHRQSTPPSSAQPHQTVTYTTTVTVNTNPMIATNQPSDGPARNDDGVKSMSMENSASSSSSQVRRLSVDGVLSSSSASSSLSSSPAANTANNKTQLVDVSDATLSSSIHQQDRIENGEMVMMSTKPLKSCSTSSTDSSVCSSSVSSSNVVNPNPKQQPTTTTTSLTTSKEEDEIESISPPRIAVAQFVRSPQTTVASITQPTDSPSSTSSTTVAGKKKPPPLMKKPEKSDEILRKLGRSPPSIDTNNANSAAQTALSSPPIASPPSASSNSPAANLSLRLSNSKATDV